jgi:hypothetical protein
MELARQVVVLAIVEKDLEYILKPFLWEVRYGMVSVPTMIKFLV